MRGMLMNRSYVYSTTSMTYQLLPGSTDFPACNAEDGVDVTRSRISMTALQRDTFEPTVEPACSRTLGIINNLRHSNNYSYN